MQTSTKNLAAPAAGAVEYVTKAVDGLATDSIYAGDPNPELDDAWHKLLASTHSSAHPSPPGPKGINKPVQTSTSESIPKKWRG